jgi:hypothetical protein
MQNMFLGLHRMVAGACKAETAYCSEEFELLFRRGIRHKGTILPKKAEPARLYSMIIGKKTELV